MRTGNEFDGIICGTDKVMCTTNLAQLRNAGLSNPLDVDKSTKKTRKQTPELAQAYELRSKVQRRFDPARVRRAQDYAAYISLCASGNVRGDTPPINVWMSKEGEFHDGTFNVPFGLPLVAIDGETQTLARFLLLETQPETEHTLEFPVIFHNGISLEAAEQRLHDYNRYAHPVDEKKLSSANKAGPLTIAAEKAIKLAGWSDDQVRTDGDKPRRKRGEEVSFIQVQAGIIGATEGATALSRAVATSLRVMNDPRSDVASNGVGPNFVKAMSSWPLSGDMPDALWLVAGVVSKEKGIGAINADTLVKIKTAWDSTKPQGRGGPRMKTKDRLMIAYQSV